MIIEGLHERSGKWVDLVRNYDTTLDDVETEIAGLKPGQGCVEIFGTRVDLTRFCALRIVPD